MRLQPSRAQVGDRQPGREISPADQTAFLARLAQRTLPAWPEAQDAVAELLDRLDALAAP